MARPALLLIAFVSTGMTAVAPTASGSLSPGQEPPLAAHDDEPYRWLECPMALQDDAEIDGQWAHLLRLFGRTVFARRSGSFPDTT